MKIQINVNPQVCDMSKVQFPAVVTAIAIDEQTNMAIISIDELKRIGVIGFSDIDVMPLGIPLSENVFVI